MPTGEIERYTLLAQVTHRAAAVIHAGRRRAGLGVHGDAGQTRPAALFFITLHKSIGQTIFFCGPLSADSGGASIRRLLWVVESGVGGTDRAGESLAALRDWRSPWGR